ncbi:anti-sigma factor [Cellulomonas sp.]|uniref:anti-sigma factor n=1 Tax=Cellulomonas sp. TaxID=40001 RepID=UPI002582F09C|nr:anti-sigma factor [Cellulomonas sp.]
MPLDETHVDDDVLALLALGEDAGTPDERAHLALCERCAGEVAALSEVVGLARAADTEMVAPGPQVWERIAAELELTPAAPATGAHAAPPAAPLAGPGPGPVAVQPLQPGAVSEDVGEPEAVVVPLTRRRRVAWGWIAGAAAAGVVIGGVGVGWVQSRDDRAQTVVATATLEPLPGWSAEGSATVQVARDGTRTLVVDVAEDTAPDGFREVWLLTPDVSGLVSVGTLAGSSGRFDLPAGLDLDEFSVVDVSQEPFDGNPAHSGDSIVRGALTA